MDTAIVSTSGCVFSWCKRPHESSFPPKGWRPLSEYQPESQKRTISLDISKEMAYHDRDFITKQRCQGSKDTEIRLYLIDAKERNDATRRSGASWHRGTNGAPRMSRQQHYLQ